MFGQTLDENKLDMLRKTLSIWLQNPPDYFDMSAAYKRRGNLQADRVRLLRKITAVEEEVTATIDRPRSNDAKKLKLESTKELKDDLAELEADLAIVDNEIKALEYMKDMYRNASYQLKQQQDL